ncbi:MAG: carbon storage regulator CsrA [Candidatus Jordarchaeum sp.]|uniref:carbon storage regulator CsrA n=1 Tax=Candidatus Jordarchaeum sp. TaxID=2823881 RepID=UPI00404A25D3
MLILTRKVGECIIIGENIKVYIIEIRGQQVRIGVEAPIETPIFREEIYKKIVEENRLASKIELSHLASLEENKEE